MAENNEQSNIVWLYPQLCMYMYMCCHVEHFLQGICYLKTYYATLSVSSERGSPNISLVQISPLYHVSFKLSSWYERNAIDGVSIVIHIPIISSPNFKPRSIFSVLLGQFS